MIDASDKLNSISATWMLAFENFIWKTPPPTPILWTKKSAYSPDYCHDAALHTVTFHLVSVFKNDCIPTLQTWFWQAHWWRVRVMQGWNFLGWGRFSLFSNTRRFDYFWFFPPLYSNLLDEISSRLFPCRTHHTAERLKFIGFVGLFHFNVQRGSPL